MKFLQLQEALDKASELRKSIMSKEDLERVDDLRDKDDKFAEEYGRAVHGLYDPRPKEARQTVVRGEVRRTPIDRTARLVTSKAPWWAMPPPGYKSSNPRVDILGRTMAALQTRKEKRKEKPMSQSSTTVKNNNPAAAAHGQEWTDKPKDVLNAEICAHGVKMGREATNHGQELVEKAQDARAALEYMASSFKRDWFDFRDASDARLLEIRQSRMAFETESRLLLAQLREVRQFFLDDGHEAEVVKLQEFVGLCERLKALKESGFLDTVADTMLRLA